MTHATRRARHRPTPKPSWCGLRTLEHAAAAHSCQQRANNTTLQIFTRLCTQPGAPHSRTTRTPAPRTHIPPLLQKRTIKSCSSPAPTRLPQLAVLLGSCADDFGRRLGARQPHHHNVQVVTVITCSRQAGRWCDDLDKDVIGSSSYAGGLLKGGGQGCVQHMHGKGCGAAGTRHSRNEAGWPKQDQDTRSTVTLQGWA